MVDYSRLYFIYPIISTMTWGISIVGAKAVGNFGFTPIEIVFGRFALASLLFIPILLLNSRNGNRVRPKGNEWYPIIGLAISGVALNNFIFYFGLERTEASIAAILVSFTPLATMIIATFMLGEKFTYRRLVSIIIGSVGVIFIIGITENTGSSYGNIMIIFAVSIWGSSFSFSKIASNNGFSSITITGISEILGTVFLLPVILYNRSIPKYFDNELNFEIVFWFLFMAILASVLSYILHYKAVEIFGASKVAPTINIIPFSGVIFSWIILGDSISGQPIIGLLLIILGVIMVQTEKLD